MPSMPDSARKTVTAEERDHAIECAVAMLTKALHLSEDKRCAVTLMLGRGLLTDEEQHRRDIYHAAASRHVRDGELEVDSDAVVSFSDDAGAYVQSWLWVSNDDVKDALPSGELALETSDGCTGTEVFVLNGGKVIGLGMDWDRRGEGETVSATFMVNGHEAFFLDGDGWRDLESSGQVEATIEKAMSTVLPKKTKRRKHSAPAFA